MQSVAQGTRPLQLLCHEYCMQSAALLQGYGAGQVGVVFPLAADRAAFVGPRRANVHPIFGAHQTIAYFGASDC